MAEVQMADPTSYRPPRPPRRQLDESSFTRKLRYEMMAEEGRATVVSYVVAVALGIVWLLLVYLLPAPPNAINLLPPPETAPVNVTFDNLPEPTLIETPGGGGAATPAPKPRPGGGGGGRGSNPKAIGDAFGGASGNAGGGGLVGDATNALRGVDVNSGAGGAPGMQGKAVLGYGQGGQGSRTPGRGGLGNGIGDGPGGGGLGGVGNGPGVGFAGVRVSAPSVIHAEKIGGPGRDVGELGSYVRGRQSQLQFCYQEYGLKVNPSLAGTVSVAITMTGGGDVTGVDIPRRSWSGPGAAEAESCIRQRISGWHFPPSDQGGGTYSFAFVFSR